MNTPDVSIETTLRIPGDWSGMEELAERLPHDIQLQRRAMFLADGTEFDFLPIPRDDQFPRIFRSSCRRPPSADELARVDASTVNIVLTGSGGTMANAVNLMRAGAAIVQAGGAGVFIDNSAMAHGGGNWLEMTQDADSDAVSFAFASVIRGEQEVWTMGMHVMGFPDVVMRMADIDDDGSTFVEMIRYLCSSEVPLGDGHVLADEEGPIFQAVAIPDEEFQAGSPMHNPFGRLKMMTPKDIAEGN